MKIYITSLDAYIQGILVGEWITLPMAEEELHNEIQEVLVRGQKICEDTDKHEEIFITDFECEYMDISEYDDISKLNEIAEAMEPLNEDDRKKVKFLMDNGFASNIDEAIEKYEEVLIYENQTMEDVAYALINDCYNVDSLEPLIARNINYEAIGKELEKDGVYHEVENSIYEYRY